MVAKILELRRQQCCQGRLWIYKPGPSGMASLCSMTCSPLTTHYRLESIDRRRRPRNQGTGIATNGEWIGMSWEKDTVGRTS